VGSIKVKSGANQSAASASLTGESKVLSINLPLMDSSFSSQNEDQKMQPQANASPHAKNWMRRS
jgi:hypothetical protein